MGFASKLIIRHKEAHKAQRNRLTLCALCAFLWLKSTFEAKLSR